MTRQKYPSRLVPKLTLLRLPATFLFAFVVLTVCRFAPTVSSRTARLEQDLERKFLQHQTLQLDTRTLSQQVRDTGRLSLATSDLSFDLELVPHDLRAPGYRAEEFGAGGIARQIDTGPVRTFKGRARGSEGALQLPQLGEARFTVDENRIEGLIITPSEHYFVEPAAKYSKEASATDYVIYSESDVVTPSNGECGVTLSEQVNQKAASLDIPSTEQSLEASVTAPLQELRIATEADSEYVKSKGGSLTAVQEILSIVNQVEGLYEIELGLTFRVVYQSAWSTVADPYDATNASEALGELAKLWNSERGSVARDVVHMWTGRQLDNATIGIAFLEALCRVGVGSRAAYGISKGVAGAQQIAITAHEIGHNLGATHPNQQTPPIAECDNTVMSSTVSNTPRVTFCQFSIDEIGKYIDTNTGCLGAGTTQLGFGVAANYPVGGGPTVVISQDLNGDSKDDLAVANTTSANVSVLLGKDDGTFAPAVNYAVGNKPIAVVAGDFDGDGKQDLASANQDSNNISLLRGTGTGTFEAAVNRPLGLSPRGLVSADFNLDGRHDLAVISFGSNNVAVLLGSGAVPLQVSTSFPIGSLPFEVTVSDFNNDRRQDLAISTVDGVSVLLGIDTGSFQSPITTSAGNTLITVGDFNNDGNKDLVAYSNFVSGMIFLLGTGTGSFQNPVTFSTDFIPTRVAVSNFNDDGKDDLAVLHGNAVRLLRGVGVIGFQFVGEYFTSGGITGGGHRLAIGDFNGDGQDDLAVTSFEAGFVSVLLGSGGGIFQGPSYFDAGLSPRDVAVGDFNNDGKPDIAMAGAPDSVSVLLNTGTGGLNAPVNYPAGSFPTAVAVSDFNNDGIKDLAVANGNSVNASVLLGTGTGAFQPVHSHFVGAGQSDVTVSDFNLDGKPDLAMSLGGDQVGVLLGLGNGNFLPPSSLLPVGVNPMAVVSGDFNGDGLPDLATANQQSNNISVLLGNGAGQFQSATNYGVGSGPQSITVGDFNDDGKQDCAVANRIDSSVSVLLARADGTFASPDNYVLASSPTRVVVDDFNGDGREDIATANFSGNSISILLGTGAGSFLPRLEWFVGINPIALSAGDFNVDGKPDLVLIDFGLESLTLVLNTSGVVLDRPFNDDFGSARVITEAVGTIGGTTVLATTEPFEPNHAAGSNGTGGASIWYRWKAPPSTDVIHFQTFSSSFPTVLAVYKGSSVNSLSLVARSSSSTPEYVEFLTQTDKTETDTTYYIAIDGITGDTGRTVLNWNTGSLKNDNFAFAREIRGSSGFVNGNNSTFTLEPNEPTLPGASGTGFSAWYRWTAPNTGKVIFSQLSPCGDGVTRLLGAYTGNFLDVLNLVAVNFDGYRDFDDPVICSFRTLRFNVVAGTSYRIQMRSTSGAPFVLGWHYAEPPPNDNFANALIVAGNSGSVSGTNKDASKEPGEPAHAHSVGGASIWYRWTAPVSGQVTFDTIGFRNQGSTLLRYLNSLIAVYTGASVNALTEVVSSASQNRVVFNATAGTTYHIAIDSGPYEGGGILPGIVPLHWGPNQVANDDFVNAQSLTSTTLFSPLLGSNANATKETGEPNHLGLPGGTSVWYRWTPLTNSNASFVFNKCGTCTLATSSALIAIYTGSSVNALIPVATSGTSNTFSAIRGKTYFIAVDSQTGTGGTYEFSLISTTIPPRNDFFSNAQILSGNSGAVAGDNEGATRENNEPRHANNNGGASVWYAWRAPASGLVTFDTFGSNFDTLLGVYTGNLVDQLSTVASNDNAGSSTQSRVTFDARRGSIYFIAVDGKSTGLKTSGLSQGETAFIQLNWNNLPPPANDNFANAQLISGPGGAVTGRNSVASKEGGEPHHAGNPGGVSVWYQWIAPATGGVTFNTFGSEANTLLAVYTGTAVNSLTQVTSNDDVGTLTQSRVTFNTVAGTVYYIAVDGSIGVPGNVTPFSGNLVLSWSPRLDGSNDNFVEAQILAGTSGSVAGTNVGASKENGEPNHAGDRGGRSVWHSWTAPFNGPVIFTTAGSDFDTVLAVYTGTNVNALTLVAGNDDSPYADNPTHILTSSLTFTANAGTTYQIAVDGSGGRFGNFALRWGPEAKISGQVAFIAGLCGSDKKVSLVLSGEDSRVVTFTSSGTYAFEHLRVGGNYSVRGVSEISASCLPLFLERASSFFPLAGNVSVDFIDDGLRGGGSTSNVTGHVTNGTGLGLVNVTIELSGNAQRTVYSDSAGLYQLPSLPDGSYLVTPSKPGVVFTPLSREYIFTENNSIFNADFVAVDSFNIGGQTRNGDGTVLSGVTITLSDGTQSVTVQSDNNGYYSFDAASGGSYTLTASQAGVSFTPSSRNIAILNANQHNQDFTLFSTTTVGTPVGQNVSVQLNGVTVTFSNVTGEGNTTSTPISAGTAGTLPNGYQLTGTSLAFDISTNAIVQPPITVCFNVPSVDAMEFAQLRVLHSEAGALVDRTSSHDFSARSICATVDSLSAFVITSSVIQLLGDELGPAINQAAALDAVLLLRDPFEVVNAANPFNLSSDPNTRVLLFVRNLKLAAGETPAAVIINLVGSNNQSYEVAAESVFSTPGFDFSQVKFRLPDTLATGVTVIQVRAHGQMTTQGTIRIDKK